jgi:hypothetical protein
LTTLRPPSFAGRAIIVTAPFHALLNTCFLLAPIDQVVRLLCASVSAHADHGAPCSLAPPSPRGSPNKAAKQCFFKLAATGAADMALFTAAFPRVPWVFVFRDPAEVGVTFQPPQPILELCTTLEETAPSNIWLIGWCVYRVTCLLIL